MGRSSVLQIWHCCGRGYYVPMLDIAMGARGIVRAFIVCKRTIPMISFEVKDMTCGHCASTITKAVMSADHAAKVQIDLASHRVTIEPVGANAARLQDAITQAGYTPVAV